MKGVKAYERKQIGSSVKDLPLVLSGNNIHLQPMLQDFASTHCYSAFLVLTLSRHVSSEKSEKSLTTCRGSRTKESNSLKVAWSSHSEDALGHDFLV